MTGKGLQFHVPQHAKAPKGRHLPEWRPLSLVRLNLIANPRKWISKLISSIKAPPLNKEARPPAQRFPTPHGAGTLYHTCRFMSNTGRRGQPLSHKSSVLAAGEIVCFARLTFARERGIIGSLNLIPLKTVKERVTRQDRHSELRRVGTGRGMVGRRWFRSRAPSALALGCDGPARYSGRGLLELREARRCEPRANQGGNTVI